MGFASHALHQMQGFSLKCGDIEGLEDFNGFLTLANQPRQRSRFQGLSPLLTNFLHLEGVNPKRTASALVSRSYFSEGIPTLRGSTSSDGSCRSADMRAFQQEIFGRIRSSFNLVDSLDAMSKPPNPDEPPPKGCVQGEWANPSDPYDPNGAKPFESTKLKQQALQEGPCDPMGRITSATNGQQCDYDSLCVTALPDDFCPRVFGRPCPQIVGHPWCVKVDELNRYQAPVEIKCSGSGPLAREKGSPSGCWWLKEYVGSNIQRLTGVPPDRGGLSHEEASRWAVNGEMPDRAALLPHGAPQSQPIAS